MIPSHGEFAALYRAYAPGVYRRALRLLGNQADADDIVNDVFTSLFEKPQQYAGKSAMSSFLYSVTTHACLVRLRNQRRRTKLLDERGGAPLPRTTQPNTDVAVQLRAVLETLPEPLAEVAIYYYVDELSQQEIAEILGCSRRTVGNLLSRLQARVQQQEGGT